MGVSADAPWLDIAYKLVEHGGRAVMKTSTGKVSLPGKKQIFRFRQSGRIRKDYLGLREEVHLDAETLLQKTMDEGKRIAPSPPLDELKKRFLEECESMDEGTRSIRNPAEYPVELSPRLRALLEKIQGRVYKTELGES